MFCRPRLLLFFSYFSLNGLCCDYFIFDLDAIYSVYLNKKNNLNQLKYIAGCEFSYGYSPERINPGDKQHTLKTVVKVVSGADARSLDEIARVYELVTEAGVHRASSIKVAEAAKILENTQRDINIALVNEFSIIMDKMNVNAYDVINAASTKWNFRKFLPGLVGGHCISVDSYYLAYKAEKFGYTPRVINSARLVNNSMASHIVQKTIKNLNGDPTSPKILILGCTFKEDVKDIRNSKVACIVRELHEHRAIVHVQDPHADADEMFHEYGIKLTSCHDDDYDAVIVAVSHKEYLAKCDEEFFKSIIKADGIIIDVKGVFRNKIKSLRYWC